MLGIFMLIAGALILVAALISASIGGYQTFHNGSPAGAMALLFGLIVAALVIGGVLAGIDARNALLDLTTPKPPAVSPMPAE